MQIVGCNILLNRIPNEGRIFIVQNEKEVPIKQIIDKVHRTEFLRGSKLDARGWTLDVLNCVNMIEETTFTLEQMYRFEEMFLLQRLLKQWEKMLNMFVLEYNKEF